jgi:hypothetical protein
MPMLIRTPEDIFRAEKKDIYCIQPVSEWDANTAAGKAGVEMIHQWIKDNLPGTKTEVMAPSEHSGWIMGGPTSLRVDFSEEGLKEFMRQWEDENGKSLDPRFQCYQMPYDAWWEKHGRFVPTRDKPNGIGLTVWLHTPLGFIHHQLDAEDAKLNDSHPSSYLDIWAHAKELWPELAEWDVDMVTHGKIIPREESDWLVVFMLPISFKQCFPEPSAQEIRDWFNLPEDAEVVEDIW